MTGDTPDGTQLSSPSCGIAAGQREEADALGDLIRETVDPLQLMQRVADQMVAMIDHADGVLVGLLVDPGTLRYVCGAGSLSGFVGEPLALQGSLSGAAIRGRRTLITDDTEIDGRVNRDATRAFDVRSSVCVPLGRADVPVGILNVSSARASVFDENDVELLSGLAEFISTIIGAATDLMTITNRVCAGSARRGRFMANVLDPAGAERVATRERIEQILRSRDFAIVLQPIFDLHAGEVFGLEALARFPGADSPPPDIWLTQAHEVGLGVELELALLEEALGLLDALPPWAVLTVNAGPEAISHEPVRGALAAVDPNRIVVEMTEHVPVDDYPRLAQALTGLRDAGVRLAIDDAGAGFASLMHILRLAPDFIKLDRQLVTGIDLDPVRRSLAGSLMRFAEETGATLVAEGVETATELAVLDALGIRHAQGFYLARPAPLAEILRMPRRGKARVRRQSRGVPVGVARAARAASAGA